MKILPFIGLVVLTAACVHRSNDAIIDVSDRWVGEDYILEQQGSGETLSLLKAEQWIKKGEYRQAWQELNHPELRYVVSPDFSFWKGRIQYEFGDYLQAVKYLEDAEQLGYSSYDMYVLLARVNLELERQDRALDITEILIDDRPDALNYSLRAQVLEESGDSLAARNNYNRSLRLDSSLRENYMGLGRIYLATNELEKAENLMEKAKKRFPGDAELVRLNAYILESDANYRGAIRLTSSLLDQNPNDPDLLAWRAELYMKNRQYDSAVYAATASLLYDNKVETKLVLATSLERQRLYSDALEAYEEVYASDSTNTVAAEGVKRLDGRRRYLEYLRKQRQDSIQQQQSSPDSSMSSLN